MYEIQVSFIIFDWYFKRLQKNFAYKMSKNDCEYGDWFQTKRPILMQCPPLNIIALGQHKSDNSNRIIQLIHVFVYCLGILGPAITHYNIRLIQLSDGHCRIAVKRQHITRAYYTTLFCINKKKTYNYRVEWLTSRTSPCSSWCSASSAARAEDADRCPDKTRASAPVVG